MSAGQATMAVTSVVPFVETADMPLVIIATTIGTTTAADHSTDAKLTATAEATETVYIATS